MTEEKERSTTEEPHEAIISVNWKAVQEATGESYPRDLRQVIERCGSASRICLNKWGWKKYASLELSEAVRKESRIIHPERGPLPSKYFPKKNCVISPLRVEVFDADLNVKNISNGVDDDVSFADGILHLLDAAIEIESQTDDWHLHPQFSYGSYGPDRLGNCYILADHKDLGFLKSIDTDSLPVEQQDILCFDNRHTDSPKHYRAIYRHERYYGNEQEETDKYTQEAAEIGLLGSNIGVRSSVTKMLKEEGREYEKVKELAANGQNMTIYKYEKEGEMRYAAEWTERVMIDDYLFVSMIFDRCPDKETLAQAKLIEQARQQQADN